MTSTARKLKLRPAELVQPSLELVAPAPSVTGEREPEQLLLRTLRLVESLHAQQRILVEGLRDIRESLPQQRRPLSKRTQALHIEATWRKRGGLCPCCQETPVCDPQGRLPVGEYDHWFSRAQNGAKQTWLICASCNGRLAVDTEFKASSAAAFSSYQQGLRPLLSKQTQFNLGEGSAA